MFFKGFLKSFFIAAFFKFVIFWFFKCVVFDKNINYPATFVEIVLRVFLESII
jgi:hypothetical protein